MITVIQISLMTTAVWACCLEGMILGKPVIALKNFLEDLFGYKIARYIEMPLWGCLICMASLWGAFFCAVMGVPLAEWPFVILQVCGLNAVILYFIKGMI